MGNKQTIFTDEQLEAYQDCTFFTRKEILRIYQRFRELDPLGVPEDMTGNQPHTIKVSYENIQKMTELKENPFGQRICQVFSQDGQGNLTFDDFLDMFSVLSEAAPRDIKTIYAFRIYDFDGDNHLGREDIEKTLGALTNSELTAEEIEFIVDKVFEEADLDDDGKLSYLEFEHVISRSADFMTSFHIRL